MLIQHSDYKNIANTTPVIICNPKNTIAKNPKFQA